MVINKTYYLLLLFFGITICIVSSKYNRKQKNCLLERGWICAFNGTDYRFFGSKCWMNLYNCGIQSDVKSLGKYKHVEKKLCQKAHKEYHKNDVAKHHNITIDTQNVNKCIKCNAAAAYRPVCGYNSEVNHMFKNKCHLRRFNCIHDNKRKFQATQLSNCPIPLFKESKNKKDDIAA